MYRLKLEALTAIAAWAFAAASSPSPGRNYLDGLCPRDDDLRALGAKLSSTAKVYYPGSSGFKNVTTRWSVLEEPKVNIVVVPGTENDVAEIVSPWFLNPQAHTSKRLQFAHCESRSNSQTRNNCPSSHTMASTELSPPWERWTTASASP